MAFRALHGLQSVLLSQANRVHFAFGLRQAFSDISGNPLQARQFRVVFQQRGLIVFALLMWRLAIRALERKLIT